MDISLLAVIGYSAAFAAIVAGFFLWQQNLRLQKQLERAKSGCDAASKIEVNLSEEISHLRSKIAEQLKSTKRLEKDSRAQLHNAEESRKSGEAEVSRLQLECSKQQNEVEHYRSEAEVLMAQLGEFDREKAALRQELEGVNNKFREQLAANKQKITDEIQALKKQNRELGYEKQKLAKRVEQLTHKNAKKIKDDPQDLADMRRRLNQYRYFINAFKLQKEMFEERNANWEKALHSLAEWICREQLAEGALTPDKPKNIGELVGLALQLTNQPALVDDQYSIDPHPQEQPSSESMI